MERILHLTLLLSGLCSPTSCALQDRFLLVTSKKTWAEAQSFCRENCFDLATIHNMTEMKEVSRIVNGRLEEPTWIGLRKTHKPEWHWSLQGDKFFKEGQREYFEWQSQSGACVTIQEDVLASSSCESGNRAVCFDGRVLDEPRYLFLSGSRTWLSAQDYCRSSFTDLVAIRNETEMLKVQEAAGKWKVWIGYVKDSWQWSDKSNSSFRHWSINQLMDDSNGPKCAGLKPGARWAHFLCEDKHPFLCHCPIQRIIRVRIRREDLALDLNDAAVQEDILKKLKLKMVAKNVDVSTFKLKWRKQPDGSVFIREESKEETTKKTNSNFTTCKSITFD